MNDTFETLESFARNAGYHTIILYSTIDIPMTI
jgi:hypothetical protein